jgi:3-deoxy-D-manno-octulosonic-acid transferase
MRNRERLYNAGMRVADPLSRLLAPLHPKGTAAVQGRRESAVAMREWVKRSRDVTRPLVHVHAPSVGEALMAQAIIAGVRSQRPDAQIAFTFFSPSAERVAARVGADVHGYLPIDSRSEMRALVKMLHPAAIAFVRTEIWPMLGIEASDAGARVTLVNAVLSAGSSRLRGPARFLLGPAYRRLDAVGAVAHDDAARFGLLGVPRDRTFVTGDARFDQVWNRIQSIDDNSDPIARTRANSRSFVIVAGSTWAPDEEVLVAALSNRTADTTLVVAPHEPTNTHIHALEARLDAARMTHTRLSSLRAHAAHVADAAHDKRDVIIIDSVGVLADLYSIAAAAYVGGGFGTSGLHSVVEPAALGVPVIFGPQHGNAREAADLAEAGGGFTIRDAASLTAQIDRLRDATVRRLAGTAAETFVRSRLGAAEANAALICGLITTRQ